MIEKPNDCRRLLVWFLSPMEISNIIIPIGSHFRRSADAQIEYRWRRGERREMRITMVWCVRAVNFGF